LFLVTAKEKARQKNVGIFKKEFFISIQLENICYAPNGMKK
jgi:hypothetical protein